MMCRLEKKMTWPKKNQRVGVGQEEKVMGLGRQVKSYEMRRWDDQMRRDMVRLGLGQEWMEKKEAEKPWALKEVWREIGLWFLRRDNNFH